MSLLFYLGQSWTFDATMPMVRTLFTPLNHDDHDAAHDDNDADHDGDNDDDEDQM